MALEHVFSHHDLLGMPRISICGTGHNRHADYKHIYLVMIILAIIRSDAQRPSSSQERSEKTKGSLELADKNRGAPGPRFKQTEHLPKNIA